MTKRASCTACTNIRFGVKTRRAIPHTCGKSSKEIMKLMEDSKDQDKHITDR